MGINDFIHASDIKKENDKLKKIIQDLGAGDAVAIKTKTEEYLRENLSLLNQQNDLKKIIDDYSQVIENKKKEIIVLDDEILLESFALYKPKFSFQTSEEYRHKLEDCREKQKQAIKNETAIIANNSWSVNNSKAEGKKLSNDMKKLLLRSFNNECDYCVDNVKFNTIEMNEKRIDKSFETLNKLGSIMQVFLSDYYKKLKFEELHIAFEYQQKKQEEKEEQKRVREELREQQKLELEIRIAREKIAKDKKHFSIALQDLQEKLSSSQNEKSKTEILAKIEIIQEQLTELENEEKVIDYREQNAKAGYVYVISNIGAFGENVFKIGMTRRLDPMERVDELGDASVPFAFDVHAMIFSDNAPNLEAKIHSHFYKQRINKLNDRKEFFKADIDEIEKVVKDNYDKVVDFVKEPSAQQFRESRLL